MASQFNGIPLHRRFAGMATTVVDSGPQGTVITETFTYEPVRQRARRPARAASPAPTPAPAPANTVCRPRITHRDDWGQAMPDDLIRVVDCACLAVPPTPTTLPWHAPIPAGLNAQAVRAIAVMFRQHTPERMAQMVPYLLQRCGAHGTTPVAVSNILAYLHAIHVTGDRSQEYPAAERRKALAVMLDLYGVSPAQNANSIINDARAGSWTRTIKFSGDLTLTALSTTSLTGTAVAATYMTGAYAAGQIAAIKGAATTAGAAKATALATVATLGAAAFGTATVAVGVGSAIYWAAMIDAYRDVWDNDFAKDAWLLHVMRDHHGFGTVGGPRTSVCNHPNRQWTSPTDAFNAWRLGRGHN